MTKQQISSIGFVQYLTDHEDHYPHSAVDTSDVAFTSGVIININHYAAINISEGLERLEFSGREKEVLQYMSYGFTSKEIADKMFLSIHTINQHRRNMHNRTGIPNGTALVSFALRNQIIK